MTGRAGLLAVLVGLAVGCGNDREPPPRGIAMEEGAPVATATPAPAPMRPSRRRRLPDRAGTTSPPALAEAPAAPENDEAPERDFAAELRAIAGDPTSCGELGPATAPITIRASAIVSSQGVVTRASVSGPISDAVRECLERRIGHGRFRAPVERSPRSVSAALRLEPVEPPSSIEVEVRPEWEPVGVPGRTIQGPAGTGIREASGMAIQGPSGTPIQGPSGRPIGSGGYGR